jgi:hypothetical protein
MAATEVFSRREGHKSLAHLGGVLAWPTMILNDHFKTGH